MKKVIINFSKLKKGGGQNVALNFLHGVNHYKKAELVFFVAKNSEAHNYLKNTGGWDYHVFPNNPIFCAIYELAFSFSNLKKINPDVIYTYFGYSLFYFSSVPQVTGSADSNLYFPEIDFWKDESFLRRCAKFLIDKYRIFGLKKSTAVIFENLELMNRAQYLYGLKKVYYIKPSIVKHISADGSSVALSLREPSAINLLLLCGWQRNKGILIIPYLLKLASNENIPFNVILTAGEPRCSVGREFVDLVKRLGVDEYVNIVQPVSKAALPSVYNSVDAVLLLSKLESFSNNIIEAWAYKVPLIVADESWSRSICGEAAVYANRDNSQDIFDKIMLIQNNQEYRSKVISCGCDHLASYPSINQRINEELDYVLQLSQ